MSKPDPEDFPLDEILETLGASEIVADGEQVVTIDDGPDGYAQLVALTVAALDVAQSEATARAVAFHEREVEQLPEPDTSDQGIFTAQLAELCGIEPDELPAFAKRRGDDKDTLRRALWTVCVDDRWDYMEPPLDIADLYGLGAQALKLAPRVVQRLALEWDKRADGRLAGRPGRAWHDGDQRLKSVAPRDFRLDRPRKAQ